MARSSKVRKYHLYGEEFADYAPDLVHIETITARASLHNWFIAPHRHPSILQLLFMEAGRGILLADGEEAELVLPALVLVPCDRPHAFRFSEDARGWVLSLAEALLQDPRLAPHGLDRLSRASHVLSLPIAQDPARSTLMAQMLREMQRRRDSGETELGNGLCALLTLILTLADEVASLDVEQRAGPASPRSMLMRRFNQMLEARFRENLSVGDYASELGTSAATLGRACRDMTGRPPGQLIVERRLLEAKRSLSFTNATVSQISGDLGFSDPAYFARSFRQHVGLTASEYRRKNTLPAG